MQSVIQPAVLEVLADQEGATRPSKEREAETEGSLLQRYLSTDQPVLLGVQGEGLREGRAELHPSEEPQEDLKGG